VHEVKYHGGQLTEERVFQVELQRALRVYADARVELGEFASRVARPILDSSIGLERDSALPVIRMHYILEDVVVLAMFARRHPFLALAQSYPDHETELEHKTPGNLHSPTLYQSIAESIPEGAKFERARRRFYWRLRDAANVQPSVLDDYDLSQLGYGFDYGDFYTVCKFMDEQDERDLAFGEEVRETEVRELREQFLPAASLLWASGLPSLLEGRLGGWREHGVDSAWPLSQKIMLSAGTARIEASHLDVLAPMQFDCSRQRLSRELADVGIWTPSPIWTDSILERFEYMLANDESEQAFQHLFEAYPEFILDELHIEPYPQLLLFQRDDGRTLRPDFAVRRHNSVFLDLIEIKRPGCKLITGTRTRPKLSEEARTAIAQLLDYRGFFRSAENRKWIQKKHKLDGFEPRLTLIIGRRKPALDPVVWAKATSGAEVEIVTYDDIADAARARRRWLP
jgi:hypothetical protein